MRYLNVILIKEALSIPEFLLAMLVIGIVISIAFVLISSGAEKSKEVAKKIKVKIEQRKENHELNKKIRTDISEYQELKNSFQYFSDNKLLNIYREIQDNKKNSNMEQLALEEELVKRKLITHSPMHEKLYYLDKEISKKN